MSRRSKGEGSLYKRDDGLWVGQIYLPSGKKKVKYGKTQKLVRDWLQEQKEAVSKGIYVDSKEITLEAFLNSIHKLCCHFFEAQNTRKLYIPDKEPYRSGIGQL